MFRSFAMGIVVAVCISSSAVASWGDDGNTPKSMSAEKQAVITMARKWLSGEANTRLVLDTASRFVEKFEKSSGKRLVRPGADDQPDISAQIELRKNGSKTERWLRGRVGEKSQQGYVLVRIEISRTSPGAPIDLLSGEVGDYRRLGSGSSIPWLLPEVKDGIFEKNLEGMIRIGSQSGPSDSILFAFAVPVGGGRITVLDASHEVIDIRK